jgi:hypothetical protein
MLKSEKYFMEMWLGFLVELTGFLKQALRRSLAHTSCSTQNGRGMLADD